jgi:hypothetical protein
MEQAVNLINNCCHVGWSVLYSLNADWLCASYAKNTPEIESFVPRALFIIDEHQPLLRPCTITRIVLK